MNNEFDLQQRGEEAYALYASDPRWKAPDYLHALPIDLRGSIMYCVHIILGNIEVSPEEVIVAHRNAVENIFMFKEGQRYLEEQLQIVTRVLH